MKAASPSNPEEHLLLRALRGERTPRTPVWMMRQAGRFDPQYRSIRASAGLELEELFASAEHAVQITPLPQRFGVDALILFQDILTPLGPMGLPFVFRPGPVSEHAVTDAALADRLRAFDPAEAMPYVFDSIRGVLRDLGDALPLLGFAGAPFTLFTYAVCGGSPGETGSGRVAAFLRDHADAAERLLERLAEVTADYLTAQIAAGVHAVQLFESSAGLLDEPDYARWALPYQTRVVRHVQTRCAGTPVILFAREVRPEVLVATGAQAISIGTDFDLAEARETVSPGVGLQGNVDPLLLRDGTCEQVEASARAAIDAGRHQGHVLNLGHGVRKETPVENFETMVRVAHEHRCQPSEAHASA
ncbi:MAG: uroporphyrinogen decarboxylase family protein [Planctomycetota bacterium]